jgi:O-antigen/teichoic acid export membrane protein
MSARQARIARHTALNLFGQGAPLIAAFFAIPVITRALGPERFGVLTIGWAVLGYFSLFDFGLGRALTSLVAIAADTHDEERLGRLIWTCLAAMVPLGLAGLVVTWMFAGVLASDVLRISAGLQQETLATLRVLAVAVPVVIVTTGLRGVLEGLHRFDLSNALRLPMGLATFLAPVAVLPFTRSLPVIVGALLAARVVSLVAHWWFVVHVVPVLRRRVAIARSELRELLRFGSWMTVSNLLSPLMVTGDRFVIGGLISMTAVAYYTAPWEAITKLLMIPAAASMALFPAFSAGFRADPGLVRSRYELWMNVMLYGLAPVVLVTLLFGGDILRIWLGAEYGTNSAAVLRVLAVGVLVNSLGYMSYALVQAVGRPDLTAKAHALELPVYALLLWFLATRFGIAGVAVAWSLRCAIDAAVLHAMARRLLGETRAPLRTGRTLAMGMLAVLLAGATLPEGIGARIAYLAAGMLILGAVVWWLVLRGSERSALLARVNLAPRSASTPR